MAILSLQRTVGQLRHWAEPSREQTLADDVLLREFARSRSESAFAELVRRHGTMVQGVARRVLGDHHAAEDVLQSTFLLLARKAAIISWRSNVAPWLHAAAYRLACEARRQQARQPESRAILPATAAANPPDQPLLWQEVRTAIDEELARLPAALQSPLLLCYWQGLTRDEAAQRLGWSLATLKRRLEQGRGRLQDHLTRRGLALGTLLAALAAGDDTISADVVASLARDAVAVPSATGALLLANVARWRQLAAVALLLAVGIGSWVAGAKPAAREQPPEAPATKPANAPRTDALGDPLPEGAVSRLGTARLRPGQWIKALAFSPDGSRLAIWDQERLTISDTATGRELRNINLPFCAVLRLSWLADGRGFAVVNLGSNDYFVWEFTDAKAQLPRRGSALTRMMPSGNLSSVAISPDGKWLATGRSSVDGTRQPVELQELSSNSPLNPAGRELGKQAGHAMILLFSADSRRLFALSCVQQPGRQANGGPGPRPWIPGPLAEQAQLVVYETMSGNRIREFDVAPPLLETTITGSLLSADRLALSPDGKTLYLGDQKGTIHAYDWAAGKEMAAVSAHMKDDVKQFQWPGVRALAVSRDGRLLFTSGSADGYTVWDTTTWKPRRKTQEPLIRVDQLALSPDANTLAILTQGVSADLRLLDARTGAEKVSLPGHAGMLLGMAIAPDGAIVTMGTDKTVRRWNPETGREASLKRFGGPRFWPITHALTSDQRGLFGLEDNQVVYVDLTTGQKSTVTANVPDRMTIVSKGGEEPLNIILGVSGASVFVSSQDGRVRQWDGKTGRLLNTFDVPVAEEGERCTTYRAATSASGRDLVILSERSVSTAGRGSTPRSLISIFDPSTARLRKRWKTAESPGVTFAEAAFSADGRFLIFGGSYYPHRASVVNDESTLPISLDSGLLLFDARTLEPIRTFEPAAKAVNDYSSVTALAIAPSALFFAAALHDGTIGLHELATGNIVHTFRGHRNQVTQLAFTPDGRRLVSSSRDMTGLVWDTSFPALAKPHADATRDRLWTDLAKPEWELAGPAMATLASRSDDLLALVRERLQPAATGDLDPEAVKKLVDQLNDPLFAVRDRASTALSRQGREALPLLQESLGRATVAEQRQRLQKVIQAVARSPVPSDSLRQLRLLALLEQNGTTEARAELKRLAGGHADAALTRDARAALDRASDLTKTQD